MSLIREVVQLPPDEPGAELDNFRIWPLWAADCPNAKRHKQLYPPSQDHETIHVALLAQSMVHSKCSKDVSNLHSSSASVFKKQAGTEKSALALTPGRNRFLLRNMIKPVQASHSTANYLYPGASSAQEIAANPGLQ